LSQNQKDPDVIERVTSFVIETAWPWSREHWQYLSILVAIVAAALLVRGAINPPIQVVKVPVADHLVAGKIAGLERDVKRLADDARAQEGLRKEAENKLAEFTEQSDKASAVLSDAVEPSFIARHMLAMKRRGSPARQSNFCLAYTEAYRAGAASLDVGAQVSRYVHKTMKSFIFGNDGAMMSILWQSGLITNAVGEVAASYRPELVLFSQNPKLLESFEPEMMPRSESGYPSFENARDHFTKHYEMADASDREIEDAFCFVSFMARRHEEHGPGAVSVILDILRETVERLHYPKDRDKQKAKSPVETKF
jgi:hypothetical protein